jgi:dihydroorotate dehydrogenase (NAD+) catalytic subunit
MSGGLSFLGVECKNRSVLASGILGVTMSSLNKALEAGAGIVTSKSIGPERRKGHHGPVVHDWGCGLVNAVGLSNPGIEEFCAGFEARRPPFPLIVSIFGRRTEDFPELARRLEELRFSFLELNLSCPNVLDEFGTPFSFSEELTSRITRSVKDSTSKKLIVKLSPNAPNCIPVARSAQNAGADAICMMNTLGPGMVIHPAVAFPVLGNSVGGVSGRAILPLTVKKVFELYVEVDIPIIGTGGVSDTDGALQLLMAGARLYGVGSAVYTKGLSIFGEIEEGIREFCALNGFESSEEIIGIAHGRGKRRFYLLPGVRGTQTGEGCGYGASSVQSAAGVPGAPGGAPIVFGGTGARDAARPVFRVLPVSEMLPGEGGRAGTLFFQWESRPRPAAGQFFMLWIPGEDQKPFSVSYFDGRSIGFSVLKKGPFSTALLALRKGDPVGLLGPLGKGFDLGVFPGRPRGRAHAGAPRYLLVGGGIGAAPLVFAAATLVQSGARAVLFAGGKESWAVRWVEGLLEKTGRGGEVTLLYCTEDGSCGSTGLITDHLREVIRNECPDRALACGPERFMVKALAIFGESGVQGEASIERMMKCGIGICGSCCIDDTGDRVCAEGPVFSFDYLRAAREFGRYRRDESGGVTGIE